MNTIFFRSFLVLVLATSIILPLNSFANTELSFKQSWTEQAIQNLDDNDLSLLANFVYFDFVSSMYDAQVRAQLNSLHKALLLIQTNAENYQNVPFSMEQFAAVSKEIKELLPLQQSTFKTWQACSQDIDEQAGAELLDVVNQLAQEGKNKINAELNDNNETLLFTYQEMQKSLADFNKKIIFSEGFFQAIIEGQSPFYAQSEEDQKAAELSAIFSMTNSLLQSDSQLYDRISIIKQIGVTLLRLNTLFFGECYQLLYEKLSVTKPHTLVIQYDQNGKLPPFKQTHLLPSIHAFFQ